MLFRSGTEYLVDVRPLPNDASCQQCHGSDHALRGAVLVTTSMDDVQAAVQAKITRIAAVFIGGLAILLVVLAFALRVAVLKPLRKVVTVMRNIANGDMSQRVVVISQDEVGDLADIPGEGGAAAMHQVDDRERDESDPESDHPLVGRVAARRFRWPPGGCHRDRRATVLIFSVRHAPVPS